MTSSEIKRIIELIQFYIEYETDDIYVYLPNAEDCHTMSTLLDNTCYEGYDTQDELLQMTEFDAKRLLHIDNSNYHLAFIDATKFQCDAETIESLFTTSKVVDFHQENTCEDCGNWLDDCCCELYGDEDDDDDDDDDTAYIPQAYLYSPTPAVGAICREPASPKVKRNLSHFLKAK